MIQQTLDYLRPVFAYQGTKVYQTYMPGDEITMKLENLFLGNGRSTGSYGLTGQFINYPAKFIIKPNWTIGYAHKQRLNYAYLEGLISPGEGGKTQIAVKTKPAFFFPAGMVATVGLAVFFIANFFSQQSDLKFMLTGLVLGLFVFPMIVGLSKAVTLGIRKDFESILGL